MKTSRRDAVSAAVRLAGTVAVCGLAASMAASAKGSFRDEQTTSRRVEFSGGGTRTLDARTLSGSIRVTGDGGRDVRVDARTVIEAETDAALRTAQRQVVVDAQGQGATVSVAVRDGDTPTCGEQRAWRTPAWWDRRQYDAAVSLTIRAPRDVRVRLCTVNGSEVVVSGIDGDFDVSNVNGTIEMHDLRGSGRASTVNGGIEASFDEAPASESSFKTVNGDISVTMPRSLSADLHLKTFNGGLFTDFDTVALPVTAERVQQRGGDRPRYVYRRGGFTNVRVGHGGPVLTFDTLNGDVKIHRAAR
jgi:hypothetical protein